MADGTTHKNYSSLSDAELESVEETLVAELESPDGGGEQGQRDRDDVDAAIADGDEAAAALKDAAITDVLIDEMFADGGDDDDDDLI